MPELHSYGLQLRHSSAELTSKEKEVGKYTASTIAKWFIAYANADEADLSNLKLQKLLYYAQGHHLAVLGTVLFSDPIEAWVHGPVVASVYHEYKHFDSADVTLDPVDPFDWDDVDDETAQFLLDVWGAYGGFAAWRLRNMTHEEQPWSVTFDADVRNKVIPVELIRSFFESRTTAR